MALNLGFLYDGTDSGGGGGSDAPAGGAGGAAGAGAGAGGTVYDLSDDAMVRVPGSDRPIKFSEYKAGYVPRADFDRTSSEYGAYKQKVQQTLLQYVAGLQRGGQAGQAQAGAAKDEMEELLAKVEGAQYVDGPGLATVIRQVLSRMRSADTQKALGMLYQHNQQLGKRLQAIEGQRSQESLNATVRSWLKDNDYDPEYYEDLALDLIAGYEGKPVDILNKVVKARIEKIEKGKEARTIKAKQLPFEPRLPGRGGDNRFATKAKDLSQASPAQIADAFWPHMSGDTE